MKNNCMQNLIILTIYQWIDNQGIKTNFFLNKPNLYPFTLYFMYDKLYQSSTSIDGEICNDMLAIIINLILDSCIL